MAKLDYFAGFKIIFKYLKPHSRSIFILIFLSIISSLSSSFLPYVVGKILDVIKSDQTIYFFGFYIFLPIIFIGGWFLIKIIGDLADWRIDVKTEHLSAIVPGEYMVNGFSRLLELPMSFHKSQKIGEISNRISRAAEWLSNILSNVIINLAPSFLSIFVAFIIILSIKPLFGGIFAVTIIIYSFILIKISPKLVSMQLRMHKAYNRAYGDAYDAAANVQAIKQATAEKFERRKLYKSFQLQAVKFYNDYISVWQSFSQVQKILVSLTQLSIFLISYYLIRQGQLTIGQLVMFNSYGLMILWPFVTLGRNWQTIQNGLVALQRAEKILSLPAEPYDLSTDIILSDLKGDITFKNVYFVYDKGRVILKDISFNVMAGQIVALVGQSGVGKTTIIDLLSRFYKPQRGKIIVDGHNVENLNLSFLRKNIAVVPQEVVLFNDTIKNNIKYGNFNASDDDVKKAAQMAYADKFIEAFPKKYNQIVGERGVKLSVGQKQRVAIARAVLRNPRILILDEPTSALDAESEKYVTEALEELMKGKTTFIIAHRLSTVRKADKIIVLDKGQVVEIGEHDELMQKSTGVYKKLYELQFGLK